MRDDGAVAEIIGIANNITDRKLQEKEAKHFAAHDHLTGLTNRRAFEDAVHKHTSENPNGLYAIMLIDLDAFKSVNNRLVHLAGDVVLKQAANRIENAIAEKSGSALVNRMGGDEFSAYIPHVEKQEIIGIAKNIISNTSEPYMLPNGSILLGASIGISLFSSDSSVFGQLLHYAVFLHSAGGNSRKFYVFRHFAYKFRRECI